MADPNTCQEIAVYDHLTNTTVLLDACSNNDCCHYLATGITSLLVFLGFAGCCIYAISAGFSRRKTGTGTGTDTDTSPPSYGTV